VNNRTYVCFACRPVARIPAQRTINHVGRRFALTAGLCVFLFACSGHESGDTDGSRLSLRQISSHLEELSSDTTFASDQLEMVMTLQEIGGRNVVHCRLKNRFQRPLVLNQSALPWKAPIYFHGTLVTASGYTTSIFPSVIAYIQGLPLPLSLAPNEVIEGDFETKYFPKRM